MKYQTVPFVGGFYSDDTKSWSVQDCLNYIPVTAEVAGTRTIQKLTTAPGLKPSLYFGTNPIRGTYNCEGKLFVLSGTNLYFVTANNVATLVGTVPGVGRVSFAHNQISNGNQILVNNGSAGYVYDTVAKTFTRITDAGYPGGKSAIFIDSYIVQIEPAGRYAFNSGVADATSYNTLDRFTSEVSPDLLVGLAVVNNELVMFSQTTTEFFEDTGATEQPFRTKNITMTRGCASGFSIVNVDNTLYWLGNDGIFYALNGYQPMRVSTFPIEQEILGNDWSQCFGFVYESRGHKICYWTFPDGKTWGYDVASRVWHRRASYGSDRWRLNSLTYWNNQWIAGDAYSGVLWTLDWDFMLEGDTPYICQRTTGVLSDNQNLVLVPRLEVVMETGQSETGAISPTAGIVSVSGNVPNATQGDTVSYQYSATGGVAPFTYTVISGALPSGISLSSSGLFSGTYTGSGTYAWTIQVTDAIGSTATLADGNVVASALIYTWSTVGGLNNTPMNVAFIDTDTIAIGHNGGGYVSYSYDRGATFAVARTPNTSMAITGLVKYGGDWWAFGYAGATGNIAAKTTGNDLTTFASSSITFNPGQNPNCAFVHGNYMYVGSNVSAPTTYKINRYDGATWTQINTGIASRGTNAGIACFAYINGFYLIGTVDGYVLRSSDLATFSIVFTSSSSSVPIDGIAVSGNKIILGTGDGFIYQSSDNGATWGSSYTASGGTSGGRLVIANNAMFASASTTSLEVFTSLTGANGSWTSRLTTGLQERGYGYATSNLAVYPTFGSFAVVGTT